MVDFVRYLLQGRMLLALILLLFDVETILRSILCGISHKDNSVGDFVWYLM